MAYYAKSLASVLFFLTKNFNKKLKKEDKRFLFKVK